MQQHDNVSNARQQGRNILKQRRRVAIVLSAGGTMGLFHVGFLEELLKDDTIEVASVYGCSIGAVIAPFVVLNRLEIVRTLLLNPSLDLPKRAVKAIRDGTAGVSKDELDAAFKKCHVVAWDYTRRRNRWFTGDELMSGIVASATVWLLMSPAAFHGRPFVDGAVCSIVPDPTHVISDCQAPDRRIDDVILVQCYANDAPPRRKYPRWNPLSLMTDLHVESMTYIGKLHVETYRRELGSRFTYVLPDKDHLTSSFDVSEERMQATYRSGMQHFYTNYITTNKYMKYYLG